MMVLAESLLSFKCIGVGGWVGEGGGGGGEVAPGLFPCFLFVCLKWHAIFIVFNLVD